MTNHALKYGRDRPNEASQYPTILSTRFKFTICKQSGEFIHLTVFNNGGFWGNTIYLV